MAAKAKRAPAKRAAAKTKADGPNVDEILHALKRSASAKYRADMAARYGIVTKAEVYGTTVATLRDALSRLRC